MRKKLFQKKVDKSVLNDGLTIMKKDVEAIYQKVETTLAKGEKQDIAILIDGLPYKAKLTNIALQSDEERTQIRYSRNEPIAQRLKEKFPFTQRYVENHWEKGKKQMLQTDERIDVYPAGKDSLKFVCIPHHEDDIPPQERIARIKSYIASRGFSYPEGMIENLYLCLKSKPFVILAGISGTGKTRLVKLFAEAIGATVENGRMKLVPVHPEWSDSSELIGHNDLNGHFVPGAILDFLEAAEEDPTQPYFLCLDEMNLARVEYYFSDILSIIETRSWHQEEDQPARIVTDPLITSAFYGRDSQAIDAYGKRVGLPDNVYIIGTVNMDETTFPFSRKVLDRANTMEFSDVNLVPEFSEMTTSAQPIPTDNHFLRAPYLMLRDCSEEQEIVLPICEQLEELNTILAQCHAQVGYRVRDEIVFYCLTNQKEQLLSTNQAMDFCIMQKILPRLQGGDENLRKMLGRIFQFCLGSQVGNLPTDASAQQMRERADIKDGLYPMSALKVAFMAERLENDGFTSFWL